MSATLRTSDFTENRRLFPTPPPVVEVPSRQFPVHVHHAKRTEMDNYVGEAFEKVVKIHTQLPAGGILVFLTGSSEIEAFCDRLRAHFHKKRLKELTEKLRAEAAESAGGSLPDGTEGSGTGVLVRKPNVDEEGKIKPESFVAEQESGLIKGVDKEGGLIVDFGGDKEDKEAEGGQESEASASKEGEDTGEDESDEETSSDEEEEEEDEEDEDNGSGSDESKSDEGDEELEGSDVDWEDQEAFAFSDDEDEGGSGDMAEGKKQKGDKGKETESKDSKKSQGPKLRGRISPVHVLPLYALLPRQQQLKVFDAPPRGHRPIIVATNVAETSVTIPGIRQAYDQGSCPLTCVHLLRSLFLFLPLKSLFTQESESSSFSFALIHCLCLQVLLGHVAASFPSLP